VPASAKAVLLTVTRLAVKTSLLLKLAVPVAHIWFLRSVPSKIGLVLDSSIQALSQMEQFNSMLDLNDYAAKSIPHLYINLIKKIKGKSIIIKDWK